MTVTQIPWAPGAEYVKITCRLGEPRPDGQDEDLYPDLMSQTGTVELTCDAKRIRYNETDTRQRMLTMRTWVFSIRASDGELFDPATGSVGVYVLSGSSAGVDPSGFTWSATVRPSAGDSWRATIPASAVGTFDLVAGADVIAPIPGESTLTSRVSALEAAGTSGGYPVQQVALTGNLAYTLPAGAPADQVISVVFTQDGTGGHTVTYGGAPVTVDTAAGAATAVELWPGGSVVYPGATPGGTRGLVITDANVTTIPAGDAVDNLAAYYNSGAAAITVQGTSIAAGAHAVWAWVSGAWVLLAAGTGGTPPPDGETITKAPAAPTFNTFAHTLTIPSDTGVTYQLSCTGAVSPVDALAGTWTVTTGAFASVDTGTKTITLTAYPGTVYVGTTAQAGYLLSEPSSWSAEFAETVSPYVAAAPADTQYLFVLDDAPGTTIPANSGTAGTTGVGRNGTLTYGAVTSGVGATAVKGNGAADIRLNGVLTSAATAWTWCAVVTAPVGKGLNLAADGGTDPIFKVGYIIYEWNMLKDWNSKNAVTFKWGTPGSMPGVYGSGPTALSSAGATRTWAQGDRLLVAATWDGAVFKTWLGDGVGLQLASSVADAGPVTTPATWQILRSSMPELTDTNAPVRSVGGLIAHVGRAFTQAELEALNAAVVRP